MNSELSEFILTLESDIAAIPGTRKEKLRELSEAIGRKLNEEKPSNLIFICTHNSRRSHFCQIWAAALADHLGVSDVNTFSGGTEVTAFNPRAVDAILRAGFRVKNPGGENPRYLVRYSDNNEREPLICFSKKFDDPWNPLNDIIAVMTCSDADRHCPSVPGADYRISIPFDDPKQADNSPLESQVYDERCRQIATEMLYMISELDS